jgi:metallo-beta-lactamase family protein
MAKHTLGRKIVERAAQVKIFGVEHWLRADVEVLNAFSAHADKNELLAFAQKSGKDSKRVFLVHGEPDQQEPLAKELTSAGLSPHIAIPGEIAKL